MKQAKDLQKKFREEERGMLVGLLKALFELTAAGDLIWTRHLPARFQRESKISKQKNVRQFFYTVAIETASWTLQSDDNGNPLLECFRTDDESRLLTSDEALKLIDVGALLKEVERRRQEELDKYEMRMTRLKEVLQELHEMQQEHQQPVPIVPDESVEPGKPEEPAEHGDRALPLTEAGRAAEAEEEYLERSAEVEAEFIEDCKAAEAEVEDAGGSVVGERYLAWCAETGADPEDCRTAEDYKTAEAEGVGDPAELLDSLPGQAPPALSVLPAVPPPDPEESGPSARPTARRRRKKRIRVLDDDAES